MKLKQKLRAEKSAATIISFVCIIMSTLVFHGCEKDDLFIEDSVEDKILQLADKYGLNVSFNPSHAVEKTELESFEELELIFLTLVKERENKISKEFEVKEMKDGHIIASTIDSSNPVVLSRLKSSSIESEGASFSKWFYDLTWFNVAITYNKTGSTISDISVSSYYSGTSLYSYAQLSSSSSVNESIINFSIAGKESKTYTIMGVSFTESRSITASGNFNTNTSTGTISLSGNGYWFQD